MAGTYENHLTARRVPPIPEEAKAFIVADTRITAGHNDEMDWDVEEVAKQDAVEVLVPPESPKATRVRFHPGAELPRSMVENSPDGGSGAWKAFNDKIIAVDGNGSPISTGSEDTGNSAINQWQQDKRRRSSGSK